LQICENLKGWPKIFKKMLFFGQIFPFLAKKKILGGQGFGFFQVGGGVCQG
jgi:hypothetical protein